MSYYKEARKRHLKRDGKYWLSQMKHIYSILEKLNIGSVLDFGCSSGYFLQTLKYSEKYGYDNDEYALKLAQKKKLRVTSNWNEIPSVNCIIAIDVVEHLKSEELVDWISKWYRKISDDGYLLVQTENPYCLASVMDFYNDWTHQRLYGEWTLRNLLELEGFIKICSGKSYKMLKGGLEQIYRFLEFPYTQECYGKYWILLRKDKKGKRALENQKLAVLLKQETERQMIIENKLYYLLKSIQHPIQAIRTYRRLFKK